MPRSRNLDFGTFFLLLFGTGSLLFAALTLFVSLVTGFSGSKAVAIAAGLLGAGLAWQARQRARLRQLLLAVVTNLVLLELLLQVSVFARLLPGVHISHSVPYGRIYVTEEGRNHSLMNRFGWHYPRATFSDSAHKIVLIGDSFVEALQVQRRQHAGVFLEQHLNNGLAPARPPVQVIALGRSGASFPHYLEMLKYAVKHDPPDEAVVFIFLGNDFRDLVPGTRRQAPSRNLIHYELAADGSARLRPESRPAHNAFRKLHAKNRKGLLFNAPRLVVSNCMTLAVSKDLWQKLRRQRQPWSLAAGDGLEAELAFLGLDDFVFERAPDAEAQEALQIAQALMLESQVFAERHGIRLHFVTIPVFPQAFYQREQGGDWSVDFAQHDFLQPERVLAEFARRHRLSLLPMGTYLQQHRVPVDSIRAMYLLDGVGHFSVAGHAYFAEALARHFYQQPGSTN